MPARRSKGPSIAVSAREYARGATGALLFSLPLLYTMEMWWAGTIATPSRLIAGMAGTFLLLLGYNRYAGIRHDTTVTEIAIDSVEELGLGLAGAACMLWILGRITPEMQASEVVSRVIVQGLVAAIGVSIGTAQLGGQSREQGATGSRDDTGPWPHVVLAACGAVILAANVAPTEEILVLGYDLSLWRLVAVAILSFALGAVVLHYSEFRGSLPAPGSGAIAIAHSSTMTYAVALFVSAALLWFFGRFDGVPPGVAASQTIVLGFAASLGASAGRLLLKS